MTEYLVLTWSFRLRVLPARSAEMTAASILLKNLGKTCAKFGGFRVRVQGLGFAVYGSVNI